MKLLSSFARSPLSYFALLGVPFLAIPAFYLLLVAVAPRPVSFGSSWGQAVIFSLGMTLMAGVYFVLLGLLAELVVKVFRRSDRVLVSQASAAKYQRAGGAA